MSRRANSANPAGAHAALTGAVIERIEAVYDKLGQPTYVRLPSLLDPGCDRLLQARGYAQERASLTLIAPPAAESRGPPDGAVALEPLPSAAWLEALNRINGREGEPAAVFDAVLERIDAPAAFAAVRREGQIVAGAYAALYDGWLCLEAVAVDPAWRRQGLGAAVVSALTGWGGRQGARACALQVGEDNAPALKLYRRLGFAQELYRYHYRRRG